MRVFQVPMHTFASNCYVVVSDAGNAFVVDPGNQSADIIAALEENHATPKYILLTHGHFDHIGAVADIVEKYGAKVVMNKDDEAQIASAAMRYNREIKKFRVNMDIRGGDTIELDELKVEVLSTPGHTRGGVCYICGDYMFTGDTLFNHDCGRTDLAGGSFPMLLSSLKRLAKIEKNYHIMPGHEEQGELFDQHEFITKLVEQSQ